MGIYNYFADLDKDGVGRKIVKFKQEILNARARGEKSSISSNSLIALLTKDGSCVGHSIIWVVNKVKDTPDFAARYSRDMQGNSQSTYDAGARLASAFASFNRNGLFVKNAQTFLNKQYKLSTVDLQLSTKELDQALLAASKRLGSGEGCLLAFLIEDTQSSHAIAIFRAGETTLFFDSNVGEYEVLGASQFFNAFAEIYKNQFKVAALYTLAIKISQKSLT